MYCRYTVYIFFFNNTCFISECLSKNISFRLTGRDERVRTNASQRQLTSTSALTRFGVQDAAYAHVHARARPRQTARGSADAARRCSETPPLLSGPTRSQFSPPPPHPPPYPPAPPLLHLHLKSAMNPGGRPSQAGGAERKKGSLWYRRSLRGSNDHPRHRHNSDSLPRAAKVRLNNMSVSTSVMISENQICFLQPRLGFTCTCIESTQSLKKSADRTFLYRLLC